MDIIVALEQSAGQLENLVLRATCVSQAVEVERHPVSAVANRARRASVAPGLRDLL